jgi:hypothetical protein
MNAGAIPALDPKERLADQDSSAYHVRALLDSNEMDCVADVAEYCEGLGQVERFAAHLAMEGDDANPPLSPNQGSAVLFFLSFIRTREGKEDHAAGGSAHCGFNHVLRWVAASMRGVPQ